MNHIAFKIDTHCFTFSLKLWLLFRQKAYESEATRMDPGLMVHHFFLFFYVDCVMIV